MASFFRFLKLYRTELVKSGTGKIIADPVRVEFFTGPRTYKVFVPQCPPVIAAGTERTVASAKEMRLSGDGLFIELIARTEESFGSRQFCEDQIDALVTQLSALISPDLFALEVWRGWLSDAHLLAGDMWLKLAEPVSVDLAKVEAEITEFSRRARSDPDLYARFTLMSKLLARAIGMAPSEEKLLWLWTVLEVFPMKDTSNIAPLVEHLAHTTGHSASDVKDRLQIGRLYGARCHLVHNGRLPFPVGQLGAVLEKLMAIDLVVIRSMGGIPYGGELDRFLG